MNHARSTGDLTPHMHCANRVKALVVGFVRRLSASSEDRRLLRIPSRVLVCASV